MNKKPLCPVCNNINWKTIGEQSFLLKDHKDNPSIKLRIEILILDWFKTENKKVTITWQVCEHCGFVCYSPRPTTDLVSLKYQRISQVLSGKPLKEFKLSPALPYNHSDWIKSRHYPVYSERAKQLYSLLKPWINDESKILDFGGAKGAILEEMVKQGISCDVVDYGVRSALSGVRYRGPTLKDIVEDYDIAICNHVLEHVAEPQSELLQVKEALRKGGIIYIEVPFELWNKKHPMPREPVTHINYFSVESIRYLLEHTGYEVLHCNYGGFRTYSGKKSIAVRAIGKKPSISLNASIAPQKPDLASFDRIRKGVINSLLEHFMSETFE